MNFKNKFFLSLFSGILLFLSFPKYGVGIVAWIALVPLLYSLNESSVRSGFFAGFITGFIFNVGLIYWIALVVVNYGYLPWTVGILTMLFLALYLGLYISLFAAGVVYFRERGLKPIIAAPLLWTCLEYAKSCLFTGFPWENLGYSQYLYYPIIQISDITGIYGITFTIVFVNALLTEVLTDFVYGNIGTVRKRIIVEMLCGLLLLLGLWGYGNLRISQVRGALDKAPLLDISIIQGNIDQSIKWNPENQIRTLGIYKSLSGLYSDSSPGIIIWPETAVPFFFQDMNYKTREVMNVAKNSGKWLLFGSPSYMEERKGLSFFNSAFLLSPEGKVAGRYDKVHLVPYGEYVPLRRFFPFISKLVKGIGDFRAGDGYHPLIMGDQKIGVLICYEGILPEAGRTYKRLGAGLLVNITNDAWFGESSAPYQHLSMVTFRAVENRLYLLRSANTGISAFIDPTGRIVSHTDLFVPAVLNGKARFIDKNTFYMAYGDIFVYLCLLSMFVLYLIYGRGEVNAGRIER